MHQQTPSSLLRAPSWAPFFRFFGYLPLVFGLFFGGASFAASDIETREIIDVDFSTVREALVESIELEGLKIREIIPFNQMLERTANALGRNDSPFAHVEIVQFCSTPLAWQMLEEDAGLMALCPLSIVLYTKRAEAGRVVLAWRLPGQATAGRQDAEKLLKKLVERAVDICRYQR